MASPPSVLPPSFSNSEPSTLIFFIFWLNESGLSEKNEKFCRIQMMFDITLIDKASVFKKKFQVSNSIALQTMYMANLPKTVRSGFFPHSCVPIISVSRKNSVSLALFPERLKNILESEIPGISGIDHGLEKAKKHSA